MAVINLPSCPTYNAGTPYLLSQAMDMTSPLGGATQRVLRVGSRFGIDVVYPSMKYDDGMAFLSRLMMSEANPVAVAFPQRGFKVGTPGSPEVDGAGQSGGVLNIKDVTPGYTLKDGQFFDFISGGRRYVHMVIGDVTAGEDGKAALGIAPLMRVSPADGDALEVSTPTLEGFIQMQSKKLSWSIAMVRRIDLKLTVIEDR